MGLKGLVTFGLWGTDPLYNVGAVRNLNIWKNSEFDVDCRFYVGNDVPSKTTDLLLEGGAQVIFMVDAPCDQTSTFWRWGAFQYSWEYYDYVLSRDVDSRPFEREFRTLRDWLGNPLPVHIIRDHPYHGVPILAGLFGVQSKSGLQDFAHMCPMKPPDDFYKKVNEKFRRDYTSNDFYQIDQHWLRFNVYNTLRNRIMAHDEFYGFERKRFRRFLGLEPDLRFCGEGFDENDEPRFPEHRKLITEFPRRSERDSLYRRNV